MITDSVSAGIGLEHLHSEARSIRCDRNVVEVIAIRFAGVVLRDGYERALLRAAHPGQLEDLDVPGLQGCDKAWPLLEPSVVVLGLGGGEGCQLICALVLD